MEKILLFAYLLEEKTNIKTFLVLLIYYTVVGYQYGTITEETPIKCKMINGT